MKVEAFAKTLKMSRAKLYICIKVGKIPPPERDPLNDRPIWDKEYADRIKQHLDNVRRSKTVIIPHL